MELLWYISPFCRGIISLLPAPNLRTKVRKRVPTERNGETSCASLGPGSSNDLAKLNFVRKRCALSFHNTRVPSVIACLVCSLRRFEIESSFLRTLYASLP